MATSRLAHESHGPPEGRVLVLLHGFPLSRRMWSQQVGPVTRAGWRLVLPDLPGHGESPPGAGPSTMDAYARDVLALLDELGIERFVLGGFSMGGYVALELARQHATRLGGLALVDTRAEPDTTEAKKKRHETAKAVRSDGVGVLERSMMPKLLTEETRRRRPDLARTVESMIRSTPAEGAARALEAMAERRDQRPLLARLDLPALVVVGEHDELTPVEASRAMDAQLPSSRLHVLPDAAHLAPLEAADGFNTALLEWLGAIGPTQGLSGSGASSRPRSRAATSP